MLNDIKKVAKILDENQKKTVAFMIVLMLFGGVLESLSISLVLPLVSTVMDDSGWNSSVYAKVICRIFGITGKRGYIEALLVLLIVIFVCKDAFLLLQYHIQFSFIAKSRYQMQHRLMNRFLHKPYLFYLSSSSGEIVRILTSDTMEAYQMLISLMQFSTEGIVCIILAVMIFIISPSITWKLTLALAVEALIIAKIVKPIMNRIGNRRRASFAAANKWLLQSINGIKSIKVANNEDFFETQYVKHADVTVDADRKFQTLSNAPRLFIEAFTVSIVFFLMFFMVLSGQDLATIIPQLSAFVVAAVRLLPSVNRLSTITNTIPYLEGGLNNIIQVIDEAKHDEDVTVAHRKSDSVSQLSFEKQIDFSNITFKYSRSEKEIFDNASFRINCGESVGIIGSSGAGKTTAVDIILGLLEPQSGEVLVDDVPTSENPEAWLSMLAYIPQSIFLMDDTIKANVVFGSDTTGRSDDDVWAALAEAQLDEFVKSLPDGIYTSIGEQGVRLSGGQRQRIGIARALYNDPKVLFFDEATSALDNETEAAIMESINNLKGRKTMVIIAHRLTTIGKCDVVYKVENGKVERTEV